MTEEQKEITKELQPIISKSVTDASTQAILQALENNVPEEEIFGSNFDKPKIRGESIFSQEGLDEIASLSSKGRAIPGQSLVNSPESKYPWENPPTHSNPREALNDIATTILQPDTAKNIVKALAEGAAAIDLSMGVLYSKFLQGDISIDNLLLLAEATTYMIMSLGEEANIKYNIEGNDLDEFDNEDEQENIDNKINEFNTAISSIKNKTVNKLDNTINKNVIPKSILDRVKQKGSEIKSLLDKGENNV